MTEYLHPRIYPAPNEMSILNFSRACAQQFQQFSSPNDLPWELENSQLHSKLFSLDREKFELSVDEAMSLFLQMRHTWELASGHVHFVRALSQHPMKLLPVKKAIAFGIGPIAGDALEARPMADNTPQTRLRVWKDMVLKSTLQLILFQCAVEYFTMDDSEKQISVYCQDPCYTLQDREFLESLGFEVVECPNGESLIDHTSLVFAPHIPVDHTVLTITRCIRHRPCILIGHSVNIVIPWFPRWDATFFPQLIDEQKESMTNIMVRFQQEHAQFGVNIPRSKIEELAFSEIKIHILQPISLYEVGDKMCNLSCTRAQSCGRRLPIEAPDVGSPIVSKE